MSVIEKLTVQGIRSFGSHDPMTVEFFRPLTLIVGHNGSGKTTLIECLKYATTGEMPPNSKGGAFVNDPKMTGSTEVKAKVQLEFHNVSGEKSVVTRLLQVTQKRLKLELSTFDAVLKRWDPETQRASSVSMKCTKLNNELQFYLGVSRAILENVIFCHQEDANWPLGESSVLKKRFDEIFDATAYTRAVEQIRSQLKRLDADIRSHREALGFLQQDKERATAARSAIEALDAQNVTLSERLRELRDNAEPEAERALAAAETAVARAAELVSARQAAEAAAATAAAQLAEARDGMHGAELDGTDAALSEELVQLAQTDSATLETSAAAEAAAREAIAVLETRRDELLEQRSELQAQVRARAGHEAALGALARTLDSEYSIPALVLDGSAPGTPLAAEERRTLGEWLQREVRGARDALEQGETAHSCARARLDGELRVLDERGVEAARQLNFTRGQLLGVEQQLEALSADSGEVSGSQAPEAAARALEEAEAQAGEARTALTAAEEAQRALEAGGAAGRAAGQLEAVRERLRKALGVAPLLASVHAAREAAAASRVSFETALAAATPAYCAITQTSELDLAVAVYVMRDVCDRLATRANATAAETKRLETALAQAQTRLQLKEQSVLGLEAAANDARSQLGAILKDGETWPAAMARIDAALEKHRRSATELGSASGMYRRFVSKARDTHTCPLCTRGYSDNAQAEQLVTRLEQILERFPDQLQGYEREVARLTAERAALEGIREPWRALRQTLDEDLPRAQADAESLRAAVSTAEAALCDGLEARDAASGKQAEALECTRLVDRARELQAQAEAFDAECDLRQREIDALGPAAAATPLDQLERQVAALEAELRAAERRVADAHGACERARARVGACEMAVAAARRRREAADAAQARRDAAVERRAGLSADAERLSAQIRAQEQAREEHNSRRQPLAAGLAQAETDWQRQRETLATRRDALQRFLAQFDDVARALAALACQNLDGRLAGVRESEAALSEEQRARANELEAARTRRVAAEAASARVAQRRALIQATLRVRQLSHATFAAQTKAEEAQRAAAAVDASSAAAKRDRLAAALSRVRGETAEKSGEARQLERQISTARAEFERAHARADEEFSRRAVQLESYERTRRDLARFGGLVESGILEYHRRKMDEINAIIAELWTQTYRGIDIDAIQIRSDREAGAAGSDTLASARSYRYRVVMIRNGVELDMRGRCSAGQKVLTSILIRLALAEAFCIHCGILALDEPTTNLDRDNVDSLADSLVSILDSRRVQSNFQLIVITHDEDFMQQLGKSQYADHFYRVFKNDHGFSEVQLEPISSL